MTRIPLIAVLATLAACGAPGSITGPDMGISSSSSRHALLVPYDPEIVAKSNAWQEYTASLRP